MVKALDMQGHELKPSDDDAVKRMIEIEKDSFEDRADYYKMIQQVYYHLSANIAELRKGGGKSNQSERYIPALWQYIANITAIISSQEIYPKYIAKLHQGENVGVAELANAYFASWREVMGWDDSMDRIIATMITAGGCVAGPYINKVELFPRQIVSIRTFNPYQYHHTRGRTWNNSPEKLLIYYLDKAELIGIYPQFEKQIADLQPVNISGADGSGGKGGGVVSAFENLPKQHQRDVRLSRRAIKVSEFYLMDTGFRKIPKEEDREKAYDENDEFLKAIKESIELPDIDEMIFNYQYHDQHIQVHQDQVELINRHLWQPEMHETVNRVLDLLNQHIQAHKVRAKNIPVEKQGHVYDYEYGWHYIIILNDTLVVDNGSHPFTEYGIRRPPLVEYTVEKDVFHERAIPLAYQLVDLAGGIMSAFNMTEDILKSRLPKLIAKKGVIKVKQLTNAPDEIVEFEGQDLHSSIMELPQAHVDSGVFIFLKQLLDGIEEGSGVFAPMRGKPGSNVRSAKQVEGLQDAGLIMTDARMSRIKPLIKRMAIDAAMMMNKITPPDEVLTPIVNGITRFISQDQLKNIQELPFAIDIVAMPGTRRISDERRQHIIEIAPVLNQMMQGNPKTPAIIAKGIGEVFKDEVPEIAAMVSELTQSWEQFIQAQTAPPGSPPEQGGESPPGQRTPGRTVQ